MLANYIISTPKRNERWASSLMIIGSSFQSVRLLAGWLWGRYPLFLLSSSAPEP